MRVRIDDGTCEGKWLDHDDVPEGARVLAPRELTQAEKQRQRALRRKRQDAAVTNGCAIGFIDGRGEPLPEATKLPDDVLAARKKAAAEA